jgi:monoamine oxidase
MRVKLGQLRSSHAAGRELPRGHITPENTDWVTGLWRAHLVLADSETSASESGYRAGAVEAATLAIKDTLHKLTADSHRA